MDERLVTRDSSVPPNQLLASIDKETQEWRASVIPDALRAEGVYRVEGKIDGMRFDWSLLADEERRGGTVRLRGEVISTTSGSVIRARVLRTNSVWVLLVGIIFAAMGILSLLSSNSWSALMLLAGGAILILVAFGRDKTIPHSDRPRAAYLVERLHHAINVAEGDALRLTPGEPRNPETNEGIRQ